MRLPFISFPTEHYTIIHNACGQISIRIYSRTCVLALSATSVRVTVYGAMWFIRKVIRTSCRLAFFFLILVAFHKWFFIEFKSNIYCAIHSFFFHLMRPKSAQSVQKSKRERDVRKKYIYFQNEIDCLRTFSHLLLLLLLLPPLLIIFKLFLLLFKHFHFCSLLWCCW